MDIRFRLIKFLPVSKQFKMEMVRALLDKIYRDEINDALRKSNHKLAEEKKVDRRFELELHDDEYDALITAKLLKMARKFLIPTPRRPNNPQEDNDFWYFSSVSGEQYLTRKGAFELRKQIREEKEARNKWREIIALLIGLLGAISSTVSAIGTTFHF